MPTIDLLKRLIACPSVTPNDAGCQDIISNQLKPFGFNIEFMHFEEVKNLWARHGIHAPLVVFAGHTDVVPPGNLANWTNDPFTPTVEGDFLYGRGAADMKSGLSAMIIAACNFVRDHPGFPGSIAFLITSDEEGPTNINGTKRVISELLNRVEMIDYCIVGEASSEHQVGDQIRVGRRGSLGAKLTLFGRQGHVAFPDLAINPIHKFTPVLHELVKTKWDDGNDFFPATTFQISNIHAGTGAGNVIPGSLEVHFNFRFSPENSAKKLQEHVRKLLEKHQLEFDLQWELSGEPFLTKQGPLVTATVESIREMTSLNPTLSTGGGTSDGRFIAPTGAEVVELGPCNQTVHQINERVRMEDVYKLTGIYYRILTKLFYPES